MCSTTTTLSLAANMSTLVATVQHNLTPVSSTALQYTGLTPGVQYTSTSSLQYTSSVGLQEFTTSPQYTSSVGLQEFTSSPHYSNSVGLQEFTSPQYTSSVGLQEFTTSPGGGLYATGDTFYTTEHIIQE